MLQHIADLSLQLKEQRQRNQQIVEAAAARKLQVSSTMHQALLKFMPGLHLRNQRVGLGMVARSKVREIRAQKEGQEKYERYLREQQAEAVSFQIKVDLPISSLLRGRDFGVSD